MLICLFNNLPNTLVSHTGWPSGPKTILFVASSRHPGVFRFSLMETRQQVTQTIEISLSDLNVILNLCCIDDIFATYDSKLYESCSTYIL